MTKRAAKAYRCRCEECEQLPPIDGLTAPQPVETQSGAANLLAAFVQRLLETRKQASD
ncbi:MULTISPECIES: hypothetical protein [unclassified Rhizobium]|uniref:hypothetical protein n=1 Tax=Rhizobium sp. TaxID=391 RepID=UPI000ABFF6F1